MIMKPMLAGKADMARISYPVFVSPKIDGIRALVKNGDVLSRNMTPIRNRYVQHLFARPQFEGFDGELVVGDPTSKDAMRATGAVMAYEGKPDVTYLVFDDFSLEDIFMKRYQRLQARVCRTKNVNVKLVEHVQVFSEEELTRLEETWLAAGYEGLMIRGIRGVYKQGRSTASQGGLLKVKRFEDTEAIILDVQEMNHNYNEAIATATGGHKRSTAAEGLRAAGIMGAVTVRNLDGGETFSVGSGFTADERLKYWGVRHKLIGKLIKYRYFPTGSKDRPRFPTFIGFRDPIDL
jgi:DNA ligase-1